MNFDEIKQTRQEHAKPILVEYKQCLDIQINAVSAGAFKNALKYTLNQWAALSTYLEQGYLKMDNNDVRTTNEAHCLGWGKSPFRGFWTGWSGRSDLLFNH